MAKPKQLTRDLVEEIYRGADAVVLYEEWFERYPELSKYFSIDSAPGIGAYYGLTKYAKRLFKRYKSYQEAAALDIIFNEITKRRMKDRLKIWKDTK